MKFFTWALVATLVTLSSAYNVADVVNLFSGLTTLSDNIKTTVKSVTVTNFAIVAPVSRLMFVS